MGNNPISNVDPDGDLPFLAIAGIGAATGIFSNGLGNVSNGQGFFSGAGSAALWGGVGAAAGFGIGSAFGKTGSFLKELGRAGAHGLSSGIQSELSGGSFGQGALSGGISSGIGSGIDALGGNAGHQVLGGGLGGGIGSAIGGGNFFDGFGQGVAVGAFNHSLHSGAEAIESALNNSDCPECLAIRAAELVGEGYSPEKALLIASWEEAFLPAMQAGAAFIPGPFDDVAILGFAAKFGGKKIFIKGLGKINSRVFHKLKPDILDVAGRGNFSKVVGKNPDIFVENGKIHLRGVGGGFKGKTYSTGLNASDFFK